MVNPFMLLVAVLALAFIIASGWALVRWQGIWRWLAALPLLLVGIVVLRIIVDTSADPTSHNLWPFELLGTMVLAFIALGGLQLGRIFTARLSQAKND